MSILYAPQVSEYFHSREAAEKVYGAATRNPFVEPLGPREPFAPPEAKAQDEREMAEIIKEGRRQRGEADDRERDSAARTGAQDRL
jgi:hypothetical protein